jgi:hypothetical protein
LSWRRSIFGDQSTEPTEQGAGRDKGGQLPKAVPTDELGFARQPNPLGVSKGPGFATELFEKNTIFLMEVFDNGLLVPVRQAGDGDEQALEVRGHRVENPSEIFATQPCN